MAYSVYQKSSTNQFVLLVFLCVWGVCRYGGFAPQSDRAADRPALADKAKNGKIANHKKEKERPSEDSSFSFHGYAQTEACCVTANLILSVSGKKPFGRIPLTYLCERMILEMHSRAFYGQTEKSGLSVIRCFSFGGFLSRSLPYLLLP